MDGFKTRIKLWDKENKIMLPSAPLWKCNFYNTDTFKYILIFSTGLRDKNDKDIYEGDIVEYPSSANDFYPVICEDLKIDEKDTIVSKVYFDEGCYMFDFQYGYEGKEVTWDEVEIVGNIHENIELLT